ncbi:MAG: BMP family ABC transporter substrate-binding protein [Eubacteriales bacterium]|nr:BMP family ABC transporter substrate-binding protein [Eubacteriales bacterium]
MNFRKIMTVILALVLVVGVFAGCAQSSVTTAAAAETTAAAAETTAAAAAEKIKVGVIYISPKNDGGWSQAHATGFANAVAAVGADKIDLKEIENINDADAQQTETALNQLVADGCQLIFATSFNYMDVVEKVALENPEIKFEHCSGYKSADNFANYFGQIEQPRYLSGIVAGRMTKTNTIGYVAAMPIPEVYRGLNAFTLGVRSVNPDAIVKVTWTNTWFNPQLEKEAAISLIDSGADVLAQHQDSTATQQAAQEKGVYGIGYDNPMYSEAIKDAYLTAPVWNWGAYYQTRLQGMVDGTWATGSYWGGMNEGVIALDAMTALVPADVQTEVNGLIDTMKAKGNDFVFAGPIKDNTGKERVAAGTSLPAADQFSMDWYVEGVVVAE